MPQSSRASYVEPHLGISAITQQEGNPRPQTPHRNLQGNGWGSPSRPDQIMPTHTTHSTPCSPPPTYASTVGSYPMPDQSTFDCKTGMRVGSDLKSAGFHHTADEQYAFRANNVVPELEGDALYFSATNAFGPVNPFELYGSVSASKQPYKPPSQQNLSHPNPSENSLESSIGDSVDNPRSELLGDLSYATELPGAPVSGYPPPKHVPHRHSQPSIELPADLRPYQPPRVKSWEGMSELPGIPRRRPVPTNRGYSMGNQHQPTNPPTRPWSQQSIPPSPPQNLSYPSPPSSNQQLSPALFAQPMRHAQSSMSLVSSIDSKPTSPTTSPIPERTWSDPVVTQPPSSQYSGHALENSGTISQPPVRPNPAKSGRMRNQKQFMDFLGSIPDRN
ncbi:hypothetical protein B0J11DRAFT_261501 [Dendryphion nanum]|uniref:Uncharacterized protein n=1 Tax=Dendryphion nanum TaxID=256645 RepID=A0A9P9IRQ5_9PLEO|nr:hypothetical protein B0J11DRAFT_261501 [Dendryphion nanum]